MVSGSTHTFSCVSAYTCAYAHACVVRVNQPLHGRKIPHKNSNVIRPSFGCVFIVGAEAGRGSYCFVLIDELL